MKKQFTQLLLSLLCISFTLSWGSPLYAQDPQSAAIAKKEINAFRRLINKYQNIYDRYKKCQNNKCIPQEKEALQQELRSVAKQAAIIGTGIIAIVSGGIAAFVIYRKTRQKDSEPVKPDKEEEEEIPTQPQEPPTSEQEAKRREEELKKQQEKEQKQIEETRRKQEEERKETERLAKEEEKQRKEQEELRKQQEKEQKRLEEERRREEERAERLRREEEDRRRQEEEKRLKDEMIRLQKETAEKKQIDEFLTSINTKFQLTESLIKEEKLGTPQILTELKDKYDYSKDSLTVDKARLLTMEVKTKLTMPTEEFVPKWKKLTDKVTQKAVDLAELSGKKQQEMQKKLQQFNYGFYYPIKETFKIDIKKASFQADIALKEFDKIFPVKK